MFPELTIRAALSRVFVRTTHVHTDDVFDDNNDDDNNANFVVVVAGLDSTINLGRPKVTTTRKFPALSGNLVNNYRSELPNSASFRFETVRRL